MLLNTFFYNKALSTFHKKCGSVTFLSKGLIRQGEIKRRLRVDLFRHVGSVLFDPYLKLKRVMRRLRGVAVRVEMFCYNFNNFRFSLLMGVRQAHALPNFMLGRSRSLAPVGLSLFVGLFLRRVRGGVFFVLLNNICFLKIKIYKKLLLSGAVRSQGCKKFFFFAEKIKIICTKMVKRHTYLYARRRSAFAPMPVRWHVNLKPKRVRQARVLFLYRIQAKRSSLSCKFFKDK